jgi:chorismate synthase
MTNINTGKGPVEIRELHGVSEMIAAEEIQVKVWGADTIPTAKEILIPVQHEGGLVAGAFSASGEMIGLVFGFRTRDPLVMHSQLVATLEEWRGQGIGAQMKWFQRSWCLEQGIRCMRWTVDPLRVANAELNVRHLGGVSSTYYVDYYGRMQGIDAGAPTDRLLLEWYLDSRRVEERAQKTPADLGFPEAEAANAVEEGRPVRPRMDFNSRQLLMRLPEGYVKMAARDAQLANLWRMQTRELFMHYFAAGYSIVEFTRVGGPAYLLEKRAGKDAD